MILKNIEKELVRYFNIKIKKPREFFEKPKPDEFDFGSLRLMFESNRNICFDMDPEFDENYEISPSNYIIVSISSSIYYTYQNEHRTLLYLIIYLDKKATKITKIDTNGGLIQQHPTFYELIYHIIFSFGLKLSDFKKILEKIKLMTVQAV